MVWAHFLKQKLEALVAFKEFQTMVETILGKKIKSIWSDNSSEFIFKTFKGHCKAKGIQQQFTPPYIPQSNIVVERFRTLVEMVRCIFHIKNVTHSLWAKIATTTTYLKNRSPKSYLENKSPLEV
jgi:transposase InsO family protein